MTVPLRKVRGFALIAVGLVAMPVPIIPGIPLIVAGAAMLGSDHPLVRTCRTWLENKGILKRSGNRLLPTVPRCLA